MCVIFIQNVTLRLFKLNSFSEGKKKRSVWVSALTFSSDFVLFSGYRPCKLIGLGVFSASYLFLTCFIHLPKQLLGYGESMAFGQLFKIRNLLWNYWDKEVLSWDGPLVQVSFLLKKKKNPFFKPVIIELWKESKCKQLQLGFSCCYLNRKKIPFQFQLYSGPRSVQMFPQAPILSLGQEEWMQRLRHQQFCGEQESEIPFRLTGANCLYRCLTRQDRSLK